MISLKEAVQILVILYVYFLFGRKLATYSSIHPIALTKKMRRFLFIIDIRKSNISVVAVIWQALIYVTIIFSLIAFFVLKTSDFWGYLCIALLGEIFIVGLPLGIYAAIGEAIKARRK